MSLQPFSGLKAQCRKCRCVEVEIKFCRHSFPQSLYFGGEYCPRPAQKPIEHFHRRCKACSYEWVEAVPAGDAP